MLPYIPNGTNNNQSASHFETTISCRNMLCKMLASFGIKNDKYDGKTNEKSRNEILIIFCCVLQMMEERCRERERRNRTERIIKSDKRKKTRKE